MRLVSALLIRNEAGPDRYLRRVLARCREFSDEIVVLDDRSTDDTASVCRAGGAIVHTRSALDARAWGNEANARRELWELACRHAPSWNDWVLIVDADMVLQGDVRALTLSYEQNAWAMPLYDAWSETEYRADQFWVGHETPRIWMVAPNRVPHGWVAQWSDRQIHVGHIPANFPAVAGVAPPDCYWVHLAYATESARKRKYEQYMAQAHLLSPFEHAHVQTILSP